MTLFDFGPLSDGGPAALAAYGYVALFLIIFLEELAVPLPLPGHSVFLFAGYLASQGSMQLVWIVPLGVLAAVAGASVMYSGCRLAGRPLLQRILKRVKRGGQAFDVAEARYRSRGWLFLPVSRLVPGTRAYGSAASGVCLMPYRQFLLFTTLASALWVTGMSYAGRMLEGNAVFVAPLFPLAAGVALAYVAVSTVVRRRTGARLA